MFICILGYINIRIYVYLFVDLEKRGVLTFVGEIGVMEITATIIIISHPSWHSVLPTPPPFCSPHVRLTALPHWHQRDASLTRPHHRKPLTYTHKNITVITHWPTHHRHISLTPQRSLTDTTEISHWHTYHRDISHIYFTYTHTPQR